MRSRSNSADSAAYSASRSASRSLSPAESSASSSRSSARRSTSRQVLSSSRRPSASRSVRCAARESSQRSGADARSSSARRRSALASRSKPPRGRVDPACEVADGGDLQRLPRAGVLEQEGSQLDDLQRRLAPCDDGVDARTVRIMGTWRAIAVTVQPRGVAAGPAVALAGDKVDHGCVRQLGVGRRWARLHGLPLSLAGPAALGTSPGGRMPTAAGTSAAGFERV